MKLTVRRVLILAPLLISLFLLQSYFWVPTYEEQTRGNPERLEEYITASIGDASILNPILSADSASSDIEGMVFEGLIDRDENLNFRGRLARSWEIYEEAFFSINESADIPGLGKAGPEETMQHLRAAKAGNLSLDDKTRRSFANITDLSLVPPKDFLVTHEKQCYL